MNCIDDELIQRYIDGEANLQEAEFVEKHVVHCSKCARDIEEQREFSTAIKRNIACLDIQPVMIPAFVAPVARKHKLSIKIRHYLYAASAACVLFLIIFLIPKRTVAKEVQLIYCFEGDFDSNQPVSKQEMVIRMIDPDGNVTEYH